VLQSYLVIKIGYEDIGYKDILDPNLLLRHMRLKKISEITVHSTPNSMAKDLASIRLTNEDNSDYRTGSDGDSYVSQHNPFPSYSR
jgi:hypothetical protein